MGELQAPPSERATASDDAPKPARRPLLARLLALWALFGVGVTQPILDLYGKNPEVFIAGRASGGRIIAFAAVAAFGPVVVAGVVLVATRAVLGERVEGVVYRVLLAVAAFTAASALFRQVLPNADLTLPLALVVALGVVVLDATVIAVRTWLRFLVILPLGALVLFLFFSESSELVWEAEASADPSVTVDNPVPVVMLIMDEFPLSSIVTPDGEINAALFPNFARLAESSHWFQNAQSNSIATTDSIPTILSSQFNEGASPTSRDHPRTLFTMLGDVYAMDVNESITTLCPADYCGVEGSGAEVAEIDTAALGDLLVDASIVWGHRTQPPSIRDRLPAIDSQWGGFAGDPPTVAPASSDDDLPLPVDGREEWVDELLAMAGGMDDEWPSNTVHYLHILAPHVPWSTNPSGTAYDRPEDLRAGVTGVENGYWLEDRAWAAQGLQRHLFQLGQIDLLLGRLLDELERSGLWDDAMIVVTADHGASFSPGDHRRWVTPTNLDALYRVPLFIRAPGQPAGEVHTENAYSKDILPTIVDVLGVGLGPEWTFAGQSLLDPDLPASRPHEYDHFTGHREALGGAVDGLFEEIDELRTLVPDQSSWSAVAAVGPYAELINTAEATVDAGVDDRVVAEVDQEAVYANLDPATGIVPTVLTGRVTLPPELSERDVIVAVNGTISGAGYRVAENGDTSIFQAVVPEEAYRPGPNEVSVLVPSGAGRWIRAGSGAVERAVLRDSAGAELPIVAADGPRVSIEGAVFERDGLHVRGWSADVDAKEPASEVLVYVGDVLLEHGPPNNRRADLADRYDSERLAMSGFDISIPASAIPAGIERVTVVGRFAGGGVVSYATISSS